jgi:hypothetical protein
MFTKYLIMKLENFIDAVFDAAGFGVGQLLGLGVQELQRSLNQQAERERERIKNMTPEEREAKKLRDEYEENEEESRKRHYDKMNSGLSVFNDPFSER